MLILGQSRKLGEICDAIRNNQQQVAYLSISMTQGQDDSCPALFKFQIFQNKEIFCDC